MKNPSPTFCVLPFGHLFLSEEGKSLPCCYALESGEVNRDAGGKAIEIRTSGDIERAWNSESQRSVRLKMLTGERPKACQRCFEAEDNGSVSLRSISNRDYGHEAAALAKKTCSDGSMPAEFFSVDLRLGNFCNLRCQMCSPVSSRKLIPDFELLYPEAKESFGGFAGIDWHKDKFIQEEILKRSGQLREAHFAGGEPFLIPEVADFVKALAEQPSAKNIRLSFNTNGTHLPERLLEMFPLFNGVRVIVSLDGLGTVNDYIRFPSRFAEIEKNLARLHESLDRWNIELVCMNSTVQIHNLFSIPELVKYFMETYPKFLAFPVLGSLNLPSCLSTKVLPAELKKRAAELLNVFVSENEAAWRSYEKRFPKDRTAEDFATEVKGVINFMESEDRSDLLPEFHRFTKVISGIRGFKLDVPGLPN